MDSYLGLIEFAFTSLFVLAWLVLEWQGRRLDRKKEAERANEDQTKS